MAELLEKPKQIASGLYLLRIKLDSQQAAPGQFINIRTCSGSGTAPLLRRPISIFNIRDGIFEIVVQQIGDGTRIICGSEPGAIDVLGPLGQGFSLPENKSVMLIGGGVGNAPLFYLAAELKKRGCRITYIYGSRSADYIYFEDEYRSAADSFILTTDDGSAGRKGFTTDAASELFKSEHFDLVCTCGPTPMMSRIAAITPADTPVEVSLENYFGCGVGLCMGCTVETALGLKRACFDGPVMDGRIILWNTMAG